MRVVGIVPAAGRATRLGALPGSKELLVVEGRPIVEHLLERLRPVCDEIRVVTRPDKRDVVDHARGARLTVVEGEPATVPASILLGLAGLGPDAIACIGFPDTLWDPPDGFVRLVDDLRAHPDASAALGVFTGEDPARSDVVGLAEGGRVEWVAVKPAEPGTTDVWGCCAARVGVLTAGLPGLSEVGHLFDRLARAGTIRGVRLGRFLDVGTPEALAAVTGRAT